MVRIIPQGRRHTNDVLSAASSFAKLQLSGTMLRSLLLAGYRKPSPVQEIAIPMARLGTDLVVKAKSGTGKTLVFALACIDRIDASSSLPQALVITPTREIAQQNAAEIKKIANNLPYPNLICGVFTGGVSVNEDKHRLRRPCQVIVGTPGRLSWLVQKRLLNLENVKLVVLDEADQLFSESLKPTVHVLMENLPNARQTLAFSATYPPDVLSEIEREMDYPQRVFVQEHQKSLIGVKQCFKCVEASQEEEAVFEAKVEALFDLFGSVLFHQAVVFCNARDRAEDVTTRLNAAGFPAAFTSGHQSQDHRNATMNAMRQFELRVIVSTDLIARGVDLERVNLVCHLDVPFDQETYRHRIGRTGRFGTYGISVNFVTQSEKERLEQFVAAVEDAELIELPPEIPKEWYKDPFANKTEQTAYEKLVETPIIPTALSTIPMGDSQWTDTQSSTEFLAWKERLEKKHAFWNHYDPYSVSRSSSREERIRIATSEMSCETGSSFQRKISCSRLLSGMSRSTSASSVVYSEEGECECLDASEDLPSWSDECECDDPSKPSLKPLQPPCLPPTIASLAEFNAVRDQYEKWRSDYQKWHQLYSKWYSSVLTSPSPPSPPHLS